MKLIILTLFLMISFPLSNADETSFDENNMNIKVLFDNWVQKFDRRYTTMMEKSHRYEIFKSNDEFIMDHNKNNKHYYLLDHNQFSDMTNEEYREYNHLLNDVESFSSKRLLLENNPKRVNWIGKGAVTKVKDQGGCGSCWAFAVTAVVEGSMFIRSGQLMDLSPQWLIDCDRLNYGCDGGGARGAFSSIVENGGLPSWKNYEYKGIDEACNTTSGIISNSQIHFFASLKNGGFSLQEALLAGPTYVSVCANSKNFQFYSSGVMNSTCGGPWNHAVTAVGTDYDEESGLWYWLIKNSWSTEWGDEGYIKISRQSSRGRIGRCEVAGDIWIAQ